jgi:2-methylcitrate dehydratase
MQLTAGSQVQNPRARHSSANVQLGFCGYRSLGRFTNSILSPSVLLSLQGEKGNVKKKDRTISEEIAAFVLRARFSNISPEVIERLKLHLLDALGCAFGALQGLPIRRLRDQIDEFGGKPICTLIGGGKSAPDRAACFNTALTRYLDFMDNFLAEGETCHPSDNIGSVLTAAEFADATGQDLLTALAVAYEVECRLTAGAPIMEKGFDHTTQLAHSIAAGTGKLLGLNEIQLGHALGLAGVELNALAVTRAAPTTQWKGFASSNVAFDAMHLVFQARSGMTGPLNVFEGVKGFEEALGKKVKVDWRKDDFSNVAKCILKRFNAEVHAQSALEGILELRRQHRFQPARIKEIEITIFHTAYDIVGGGQYGDRSKVSTREEADHSLPYMAAVAILDGDVQPQQYNPGRITRADVQGLMQKVKVHPPIRIEKPKALVEKIDPYSRKYPDQMPCKIEIKLMNGRAHEIEKTDYSGFYTRPWGWDDVTRKFRGLARRLKKTTQDEIIDMVRNLENTTAVNLMKLLGEASA